MTNLKRQTILILIIVAVFMSAVIRGEGAEQVNKDSLTADINLEPEDYSGFEMLDNFINEKEIIFTGEYHAEKTSIGLKLKFLKYFNKKGVKYYFLEDGFSAAYNINRYLKTGNEEILKELFGYLAATMSYTKENYDFIKSVYEYNKSLDEKERIIFIGCDTGADTVLALKNIVNMTDGKEAPAEIKETIDNLRNIYTTVSGKFVKGMPYMEQEKKFEEAGIKNIVKDAYEKFTANRESYREYLGDKFNDYYLQIESMDNTRILIESNNKEIKRDELSFDLFCKIYETLPKGKIFGQWGSWHTRLKVKHTIIGRLNSKWNSPVNGKVGIIKYIYLDRGTDAGRDYTSFLNNKTDAGLTLFNISTPEFKFDKEYYVYGDKEGTLQENYHYVLLIKKTQDAVKYTE